jgi:hypothetical protein
MPRARPQCRSTIRHPVDRVLQCHPPQITFHPRLTSRGPSASVSNLHHLDGRDRGLIVGKINTAHRFTATSASRLGLARWLSGQNPNQGACVSCVQPSFKLAAKTCDGAVTKRYHPPAAGCVRPETTFGATTPAVEGPSCRPFRPRPCKAFRSPDQPPRTAQDRSR